MGKKNSKGQFSATEKGLIRKTFTNTYGSIDIEIPNDIFDCYLKEVGVYRIPVKLLSHFASRKRYFLLLEVSCPEEPGYIVCYLTEDGTKHLIYSKSKNQAMFSPLPNDFYNAKAELISTQVLEGKKVNQLMEIFFIWNKPFNLVIRNTKHFVKFIEKKLKTKHNL